MTSTFRIIASASFALLIAASIGGCGRRGALEAPPDSKAAAARVGGNAAAEDIDEDEKPKMPKTGLIQDFTPGAAPSLKQNKRKQERAQQQQTPSGAGASKPFVLDFLL
jgi:predicted small lipoprotein YifL